MSDERTAPDLEEPRQKRTMRILPSCSFPDGTTETQTHSRDDPEADEGAMHRRPSPWPQAPEEPTGLHEGREGLRGATFTCSLTGTPSTSIRFVTNSTPTVLSKSSLNSLLWKRVMRLLLPTPVFPSSMTCGGVTPAARARFPRLEAEKKPFAVSGFEDQIVWW